MARVPYVEYEEASDEVRALYDGYVGHRLARMEGVPNFHRILGHVPWIYGWFIGLQVGASAGPLPTPIKRLINVQTSLVNKCGYCVSHNLGFAVQAGVPAEKLSALESGDLDSPLFTDAEAAAIQWATTVAENTARPNQEAFAALEEHFSASEIVEMTFIVAFRTLTNRMQEALWTDLEEEGSRPPRTDGGHADLAGFCGNVLLPQLKGRGSDA